MTEPRRLRILLVWGASHFGELAKDAFMDLPGHDIEIVSGDRSSGKSGHALSWKRLFDLRRRLARGEFDLVVSGPVQNDPWPWPRRLGTRLAQAARFFTYKHTMLDTWWVPWLVNRQGGGTVPLAVIDFLDTSFVLPKDLPLLRAATLYYKLNLYFWPRRSLAPLEQLLGRKRVTPLTPKLRPMTNGVPRRMVPARVRPMKERDIDICFTGTVGAHRAAGDDDPFAELNINPIRREIYHRCVALQDRYRIKAVNGMVPPDEYTELLQRTRLFVCTESFGCETYRHNDVAAAGAIPLVNWPYATNYLIFQPDVHAFYFSMIGDDFERVVARALANPARLEEMAQAGRDLVVNHKQRHLLGEHIIRETLAAAKG
jgi:hypothetical protein